MTNDLKTTLKIIIVLCGLFEFTNTYGKSNIELIYERMYKQYLYNPSENKIVLILKDLKQDGSFGSINYESQDGAPRLHIKYITDMAAAYNCPDNKYYRNEKLRLCYLSSLGYWIKKDHRAKNWWYRTIAYPKDLSQSIVLMYKHIKSVPGLLQDVTSYLYSEYETEKQKNKDLTELGANGADIVMGAFAASVINKDKDKLLEFRDVISGLLTIQKREGILSDYLFAQHCAYGRQLYFANYGKEFVRSVISYLEFCDGTEYQAAGKELLEKLFVDGVQWIYFNGYYDPNNAGRFISSETEVKTVIDLAERLERLNNKSEDLSTLVRRIKGENSLEGNRMFWNFDYMVHRRKKYMTSSRMTSVRTVGNESGNGEGTLNYCSSNGVNYLFVTGKEYSGDYFKKMNPRQFPGITAEQDSAELPIPVWGEGGNNNNAFAGGASDGEYGATGMILDRRGVNAHKACFFFDCEYVCLGCNIKAADRKSVIYTTVNQTNSDGNIIIKDSNNILKVQKCERMSSPDWVLHGQVGYFNIGKKNEYIVRFDNGLFSLNINHGLNPKNESYAYIVKPNTVNSEEAENYYKKHTIDVISNTSEIQAVRNLKSHITEIVFYDKGELIIDSKHSVKVNIPCVLIWNEKKNTLCIANPYCESNPYRNIEVKVKLENREKVIRLDLPQGEFSGSSVIFDIL